MNIIRITTELELTVHGFPEGTHAEQNEALCRLIGKHCDIYERVLPKRLYSELHMGRKVTNIPGQCVSMLVDEEGALKELETNIVGSYLYETDKHGNPIAGNILFIGEKWDEDGINFCGINEPVFESLKAQLDNMVSSIKEKTEVLGK